MYWVIHYKSLKLISTVFYLAFSIVTRPLAITLVVCICVVWLLLSRAIPHRLVCSLWALVILQHPGKPDLALHLSHLTHSLVFDLTGWKTASRLNSCRVHTIHTHAGKHTHLEKWSPPPLHTNIRLPSMRTAVSAGVRIAINRGVIRRMSSYSGIYIFWCQLQ